MNEKLYMFQVYLSIKKAAPVFMYVWYIKFSFCKVFVHLFVREIKLGICIQVLGKEFFQMLNSAIQFRLLWSLLKMTCSLIRPFSDSMFFYEDNTILYPISKQ